MRLHALHMKNAAAELENLRERSAHLHAALADAQGASEGLSSDELQKESRSARRHAFLRRMLAKVALDKAPSQDRMACVVLLAMRDVEAGRAVMAETRSRIISDSRLSRELQLGRDADASQPGDRPRLHFADGVFMFGRPTEQAKQRASAGLSGLAPPPPGPGPAPPLPPPGLTKMEEIKWKREHLPRAAPAPAPAPLHWAPPPGDAPPAPAPAPAAPLPEGMPEDMPAGLTKMEQMKWKREHKPKQAPAPAPAPTAAPDPAPPPAPTPAPDGGGEEETMPEGLCVRIPMVACSGPSADHAVCAGRRWSR